MNPASDLRERFERARAELAEAHRASTLPAEAMARHSDAVDSILRGLWASTPAGDGFALLALGGYGRRELAPGSDLDVLILHRGPSAEEVEAVSNAFTYPLWDAGVDLGNRVREPREVVRILERTDEATALLDARTVAGDQALAQELEADVLRALQRSRASFLRGLVGASTDRRRRYGHAGHLLEPDIRDSAGGLRDLHTLAWMAHVLRGEPGLVGSVEAGILVQDDLEALGAAGTFLRRVRIESHLLHGRKQDRLYLEDQDALGARLGYVDPPGDGLLRDLYAHAREAEAIVTAAWERAQRRKRSRFSRSSAQVVGDGCVLQHGRIEATAVRSPGRDAAGWIAVFGEAVRHGAPVGRATIARLRRVLAEEGASWSPGGRERFMDLLARGHDAADALGAMDRAGLLAALIPEWSRIRAKPQRDVYHRFTVDVHLFAAVGELVSSREDEDLQEAWGHVEDLDVLLLGTFLHDVGKGYDGDHSQVGAELAQGIAARMGFGPEQARSVAFLVREHLLLPQVATRRDLNDAQVIAEAAVRVADRRGLALLYLLARADSIATGPEAWSTFRASLVRELYGKLAAVLGGASPTEAAEGRAERLESVARGAGLLERPMGDREVRTAIREGQGVEELVLAAADRPGLLSIVAGVLAIRGVSIHDAEVHTTNDGVALQVLRTSTAHGPVGPDRWARVRADLEAAIVGDLDVDATLTKRGGRPRRRAAAPRAVRVVVHPDASSSATVIEIHADDRPGLLRRLTHALAATGCDVLAAKVATYGSRVVDVFYVVGPDGAPLRDPGTLDEVDAALRRAIEASQ